MPKTPKKANRSKPRKLGVFGQGGTTIRAGLYARVSTHDQQTLPMQLSAMREYVKRRGWVVALEVKDIGSGANGTRLRCNLHIRLNLRKVRILAAWGRLSRGCIRNPCFPGWLDCRRVLI